jgi:hypothetical protein
MFGVNWEDYALLSINRVRQLGGRPSVGGVFGIGATDLSNQPPLIETAHAAFLVYVRLVRRRVESGKAHVPEHIVHKNMSKEGGFTTLPPVPSAFISSETTVPLISIDQGGHCHCGSGWVKVECLRCNGVGEVHAPCSMQVEIKTGAPITQRCPSCLGKRTKLVQCSKCAGTLRSTFAQVAKIYDQVDELRCVYIPQLQGKVESSLRGLLESEVQEFPDCMAVVNERMSTSSGWTEPTPPAGPLSYWNTQVETQLRKDIEKFHHDGPGRVILRELRIGAWPFLRLLYQVGARRHEMIAIVGPRKPVDILHG